MLNYTTCGQDSLTLNRRVRAPCPPVCRLLAYQLMRHPLYTINIVFVLQITRGRGNFFLLFFIIFFALPLL